MNSSDIGGRPYGKLADAEKKKLFRNASYWAKRLEKLAESQNLKGDEYVKESEKLYRKAQKSIEDKINVWYGRFAKNNDISFSEAQKRLKTDELEEFKWTVEEYIEKARQSADGSYLKELENASARVHVNRLEFMNTQLEAAVRLLYNSNESGLKGLLGNVYEDTYYHSIFEIQKGYGVGASFSRLDTKLIDRVLSQPWAQDGSNFSSRVWSNKEELVNKLKTDFSQSLIRGESRDKIISRLSKDLEQDKKKTARLVHTETAALQNKAALDAYKELGVDEVKILGTLDSVTCSLCGSMDGKILPRTQLEQGISEPPFHPNCRCTTVPYDEDWDYKGQRIAKDDNGNDYYVPEDMSYEEWKRKFVDGSGASVDKSNDKNSSDTKLKSSAQAEEFGTDDLQYYKLVEFEGEPVEISHKGGAVTAQPISGYHNVYVSEKVLNSDSKRLKPKELHDMVKNFRLARKLLNIKDSDNLPKIVVIDSSEFVGYTPAAYNPAGNTLFVSRNIKDIMQTDSYKAQMAESDNELSTYVHELIHWKDTEEYRKTGEPIENYMEWINDKCRLKLERLANKGYDIHKISKYANASIDPRRGKPLYSEAYTEYRVLKLLGGVQ